MKLAGRIVLWILTWPVIMGWLWPLFMFCIRAARNLRMDDGILIATWRDWVVKTPRPWLNKIKWPFGLLWKQTSNGDWIRTTKDAKDATARTLWKYSQALAAGHVLWPNASERTKKHERVHYRQALGYVILGLCLGLIVSGVEGNWWWLPGLWIPPGMAIFKLPNFLVPILEGNHVYRDSEHERSAYAQTDLWSRAGEYAQLANEPKTISWLDKHLSKKRSW